MANDYQLAQFNVARLAAPLDSDQLRDFVDGLAPINALAEASDGFIWRLVDDDGADATALRPFDEDVIVNLSVWKDVESLQAFVYNSRHREFVRRRRQWFSAWQGPSYVLWWVVPGDRPTPQDGKQRLACWRHAARARTRSISVLPFRRRWPSPPPFELADVI